MGKPNEVVKTHEDQMDETGATLTVDEAHRIIGKDKISRGGFYAAINRREIPHLRLGHRILIPRHAFLKWLEAAGQSTPEAA
jgi:excisionase family DNA binding protein